MAAFGRSLARILSAVLVLATALPAGATVHVYSAILSPLQENPTNTGTRALGAGRFVIDTNANTVAYRITFSNLLGAETAAHIHGDATSSPGHNAGVLASLPGGNPKIGVWTYPESVEPLLVGGFCYANIHSTVFPNGEIRGQIVPLNAILDGAQETPPVETHGRGIATFTIDTTANVLSYYIRYDSLTGTESLAHFHGDGVHTEPAFVLQTLAVGSPKVGTWNYPQSQENAILQGRVYVNIHTSLNSGGEIRGQIVPLVVPMDGQQVVPAVTAPASAGFACICYDTTPGQNLISYDVHLGNLSSDEIESHVHAFANAGSNAAIQQVLDPGPQKLGAWLYGAANESDVLAGRSYLDVHTLNHTEGEIRGQITGFPGSNPLVDVAQESRPVAAGAFAAPNPFGGRTAVSFTLGRTGPVAMTIAGIDGRTVRAFPTALYAPGLHSLEWDGLDALGRAAAPGIYFAVVRTPDGTQTTRLARLR